MDVSHQTIFTIISVVTVPPTINIRIAVWQTICLDIHKGTKEYVEDSEGTRKTEEQKQLTSQST